MLTLTLDQIPLPLRQLSDPVKKLYVVSNNWDELIARPKIAIVGSRKVTPYGAGITKKMASQLSKQGVVIVSGLAYGIDSLAHQTTLDNKGLTIAVLPSGYNKVYPSAHRNLALKIIESGGAIITEHEGDYTPHKHDFLRRNRIIAGLSQAVVIPEAAERSGSLNTAAHAINAGLPVFAVPGNINSPMSAGCNNLLKAGAIPLTDVNDIYNNLNWQSQATSKPESDSADEQAIIDLLFNGVTDGAELLSKSGLEASLFNQCLTMLEITGRIKPLGANHWALC